MAEYIDREALIKAIDNNFAKLDIDVCNPPYYYGANDEYADVRLIIHKQPTADVKPVKYSSWECCTYPIVDRDGVARRCMRGYVCKACGHGEPEEKRFCGGCGADMRIKI